MRQANDRLCVLLGLPPEDLVKCLGTAPIPTAPATVAVGIPAQLLTRRPDIRQAERTAAAQSAQIGVAVSQAYPMVSISGTLGWQSQQLSQLFTPAAFNGTIGPTFQWNILNYGRLLNNDRLQEARFRELVAAYQQTVLQAQSEVENGLAAFVASPETGREPSRERGRNEQGGGQSPWRSGDWKRHRLQPSVRDLAEPGRSGDGPGPGPKPPSPKG